VGFFVWIVKGLLGHRCHSKDESSLVHEGMPPGRSPHLPLSQPCHEQGGRRFMGFCTGHPGMRSARWARSKGPPKASGPVSCCLNGRAGPRPRAAARPSSS
jgi:hypothetical protein